MMKFSGDPLTFTSCLDNMILNSLLDSGGKLMRSYHLCEGKAKDVIQSCMVMEPSDQGLVKARKLIAERYRGGEACMGVGDQSY